MKKTVCLLLMLLGLSFAILAQIKKIEVVEFATDTICTRKPQIIKLAKTIKLIISSHTDSILLSNDKNFLGAKWQKADSVMYWKMMPRRNQPLYYQLKFFNNTSEVFMTIPYRIDCGCLQDSKIIIDVNKDYATKQEVTIDIFSYKAKYMMISNDSGFKNAQWQDYATKLSWKLTEGQGIKRVYAKFRDSTNNLVSDATDDIILDTEAPKAHQIKILTTKESKAIFGKINRNFIYLHLKVDDVYTLRIGSITDIETQKWQKMEEFIVVENKWGSQPIYIQFCDWAGNTTKLLSLK
jgi:hypothetical protein